MKKIMVMDYCERPGSVGGTEQQMIEALQERDNEVLYYPFNSQTTDEEVSEVIQDHGPREIMWTASKAWRHGAALEKFREIRKLNFWFDDPFMRVEEDGHVEMLKAASSRSDFEFYSWDSYWSEGMRNEWGVNAKMFHLAASSDYRAFEDFEKKPQGKGLSFYGCLHSPAFIKKVMMTLPKFMRLAAEDIEAGLNGNLYEVNGRTLSWIELERKILSGKDTYSHYFNQEWDAMADQRSNFRWIVWAMSKNAVRVKLLKKALEVDQVTIFGESAQRNHANRHELRWMIGEWDPDKLEIVDLSNVRGKNLSQFYHYGKLQISATDPQSVMEGIPYRIFQCGACGVPLFTDTRPGWSSVFDDNRDYIRWTSFDEIPDRLSSALNSKSQLKWVADNLKIKVRERHMWSHRVDELHVPYKDLSDYFGEQLKTINIMNLKGVKTHANEETTNQRKEEVISIPVNLEPISEGLSDNWKLLAQPVNPIL